MAPITSKIMLRDYLQETEDAISSGRIDDALANCQRVLAHFPESLEAQRLLGEAYLAQGNLEDAQNAFDWVLTNDPENVIAYCDRALISERMADYDTALDCYQQAYELSRGNSQIRREFNQLSTKVGQQGFMFSRAGLARLYMRGDLLSQAIQEWEAVLAATPDRLDARTGLLEAYWREGQRDQVEQIASQLLQEVPGCLKALLLLAYVTAPKDMRQARSLLERAEALDPDLIMAQELFSDMLASQPADPFLQLLKRPPAALDASDVVEMSVTDRPTLESPVPDLSANGLSNGALHALPSSSEIASPWGSGDSWGTDVTLIKPPAQPVGSGDHWGSDITLLKPPSGAPSAQEQNAAPFWTADSISPSNAPGAADASHDTYFRPEAAGAENLPGSEAASADPWGALPQSPDQQDESQLEPWQMLEEALGKVDAMAQQQMESPVWEGSEDVHALPDHRLAESATSYEDLSVWGRQDSKASEAEAASNVWGASAQEQDIPAPPAWLDMLSQTEQRQIGEAPAAEQERPAVPPPDRQSSAAPSDARPAWAQDLNVVPTAPSDEEEELSFGPEWLKSLGAATLEAEGSTNSMAEIPQPREPQARVAEPQPERDPRQGQKKEEARPEPAREAWPAQAAEPEAKSLQKQAGSAEAVHESWKAPASEDAERVEQNLVKTLEELEQGLLSQGFVPMEPNSLSTIANSQGPATPDAPQPRQVPDVEQTSSLSSALAELGARQPEPQSEPPVTPKQAAPAKSGSDARWTASFRPVADPTPSPFALPATPDQSEVPTGPMPKTVTPAAAGSSQHVAGPPAPEKPPVAPQKAPTSPLARSNGVPGPVFEPVPAPPSTNNRPQETPRELPPVAPREPLLENELETTMRRPAVRLQPMQQRLMPRDMAASAKGRAEERPAGNAPDGKLSYQERLVWGYQRQLAGDYDNAMGEYRIIIRNAPELISEVVSNVRALLKLAPKYSAGYRVLGDAYMRQGEYLQAMEAYNKALTMAKRARG